MAEVMLEEVARQTELVFRRYLPEALQRVEAAMEADDLAYYTEIGQTPVPSTPLVDPVTYVIGHHPRLLERPPLDFPAVAINCFNQMALDEAGDSFVIMGHAVSIEAFMIHPDEATAHRMVWRYAKALHLVLVEHPTLDNFVEPIAEVPNVDLSEAIRRRESRTDNDEFILQGCKLEYTFRINQSWY